MGEMMTEPKKDDCIFCKIIAGKIPCAKVFEDSETLAFLDIGPINKGHVLVIPKKHYRWVWDIEEKEAEKLMPKLQRIGKAVQKATKADFVVLSVAGNEVPHAHIHLIPRFYNDGLGFWPGGKYAEGEMEQFRKKVESALK
jgi:histidine triad (HIT) family protein